jgi:hypothetical protein
VSQFASKACQVLLLVIGLSSPGESPVPLDVERLATRFTCTEQVAVERTRGETVERVEVGTYQYLLVRPRRSKDLPYLFVERRTPRPTNSPWKRLGQPVPVTWLTLAQPNPAMFQVAGACGGEHSESCNVFTGRHGFLDGFDPREWKGQVWLDERGRVQRVEAEPVNQGDPIERFGSPQPAGVGSAVIGGPPSANVPMFRVDGTVDQVRCEIEFEEMIPGVVLPTRSTCHRESVGLGGKPRGRWTLLREFSDCKEFGVESEERIEAANPGP